MMKSLRKKLKQEKVKHRLGIPSQYTSMKNLMVLGSVALADMLVRRSAKFLWKTTTHRDPPENPADRNVSWADALVWSIVTGILVNLVRLIIKRNVSVGVEENT